MKKLLTLSLIALGTLVSCGEQPVSKEEFIKQATDILNKTPVVPAYDTASISGRIKLETGEEIKSTGDSKFGVHRPGSFYTFSLINEDAFAKAAYENWNMHHFTEFRDYNMYEITKEPYTQNATYTILGYKGNPKEDCYMEMKWDKTDLFLTYFYEKHTTNNAVTYSLEISFKYSYDARD